MLAHTEVPFLNQRECLMLAAQVRSLHHLWIDRGGFYTVGAATYQDSPATYPAKANAFNPMLAFHFGPLLKQIDNFYSAWCGTPVIRPKGVGLPGFHVFTDQCNGVAGSVHVDEPYDRIAWSGEVSAPFTFTLPIELPHVGGGLNYWPDFSEQDIDQFITSGALPACEYLPYKLGHLYTHSGLTPHQIANPGDMEPYEARITLQGHGVTTEDGAVALYF